MRGTIAIIFLCLLGLTTVGLCQDEELPPEWTFDDEDEIRNWTSMNQLDPLELDEVEDQNGNLRSVLRTVSLGTDPYVYVVGGGGGFIDTIPAFDGGEYTTIYIGVRVNLPSRWQIYYITGEDAQYSERQRQDFQVDAVGGFEDLEFVMERGGWQDEVVTGFRVDPGTDPGVEAEIDYLSLRGIPDDAVQGVVEYGGKLARTWGDIKGQ